ncbi:MAG: MBL fold metallo-hydrolase [Planctomycetaceae bacterium]|nr:MBL fold metallo-hydrolase [Planctomycetaceae bacterium]
MFIWNNGLRLVKGDVAIDFIRRQPCGFVSHAHSDHLAKHETILCTPETAAICEYRLKRKGKGAKEYKKMPYFEPIFRDGLKLTTYPAGHILGSAMLHAVDEATGESLLYTGDFKLGPSATSKEAVPVYADALIMECTFGTPQHRLPPREETIPIFLQEIRNTFEQERTPVVYAYTLGKSQEITKILTDAGIPVRQQRDIYKISRIYEACGVDLGDVVPWNERIAANDRVLIIPPRNDLIQTETEPVTFAVTGWAIEKNAKYRYGVDYAFPISDHADYDDLIRMVELVAPKIVYCTHGPDSFVDRLHDLGFNAKPLGKSWQARLF